MIMTKEDFYQILCDELRLNRSLYPYYKLVDGTVSQQQFRKAYFLQRLAFIDQYVISESPEKIWDCGCGYGSTCLYLAMNGLQSYGTTLEFYADQIARRKSFWGQFGDSGLFTYEYANVFDQQSLQEVFDCIILQDTLHHIEPLQEALAIFYRALKPGGRIVLVEENGGCLLKRAMLFRQRGNRRIISVYDDVLKKEVLMGNENIRSERQWRDAFSSAGFELDERSVQYIRYFLPRHYTHDNLPLVVEKERKRAQCKSLCHYAFFGLNMVFVKKA